MIFLRPGFFWLSLLAVVVIGLFLMRFRRRREVVSSVLIWERLFARRAISPFWQRLRRLFSLLLHLLILGALLFALTRPLVSEGVPRPRVVVILLDNSASMQVDMEGGRGTRFRWAKDRILELLGRLSLRDRVMLVEAREVPRVVLPFSSLPEDYVSRVEGIEPFYGEGRLDLGLEFCLRSVQGRGRILPSVYIFSDGAGWDSLPRGDRLRLKLQMLTGWREGRGWVERVGFHSRVRFTFKEVPRGWEEFRDASARFFSVDGLPEDLGELGDLSLGEGLVKIFWQNGISLGSSFYLRRVGGGWEILDRERRLLYRIRKGGGGYEVFLPYEELSFNLARLHLLKLGEREFKERYFAVVLKGDGWQEERRVSAKLEWGGVWRDGLERMRIYFYPPPLEAGFNGAIRGFRVRRTYTSVSEYEAFVRVGYYGEGSRRFRLSFYFHPLVGGRLRGVRPLYDIRYRRRREGGRLVYEEVDRRPVRYEFTLDSGGGGRVERDLIFPRAKGDSSYISGFTFEDRWVWEGGRLEFRRFEGGVLEVRLACLEGGLEVEDGLGWDNRAYALILPPRLVQVYWIDGSGSRYLRSFFKNYQQARTLRIPAEEYYALSLEERRRLLWGGGVGGGVRAADVVVFDRCEPGLELGKGRYFFINAAGRGVPLRERLRSDGSSDFLQYTEVRDWRRDHPLLRFVNLRRLGVRQARYIQFSRRQESEGVEVLASLLEGAPLLLSYRSPRLRWVYLAMQPSDSKLVAELSFLMLMSNVIQWLGEGGGGGVRRLGYRVGERFLAGGGVGGRLRYPDGRVVELGGGEHFLTQVGIYSWEGGGERRYFVVNLFSELESLLPRRELGLGERRLVEVNIPLARELWWELAWLAVLILFLEWILFTRWKVF